MNIEVLVIAVYTIGGLIVIPLLIVLIKRKFFNSDKGVNVDSVNASANRKFSDAKKFIPVESIKDGTVKLTDEARYVASVNCKGFDLYTADVEEQFRTQEGYLAFINTINAPLTLRIDSSAVNLSASIRRHREALENTKGDLQRCYEEFTQYKKLLDGTQNPAEQDMYVNELVNIDRRCKCLENQVLHIEHLISYQEKMSGRDANPIQEERYIVDWVFNPQDYPKGITDEEVEEEARKQLAAKTEQIKHSLARANVKCTQDDDDALFNLSFRHFHPFLSGMNDNDVVTNYEDRIVSGERNFRDAQKRYIRVSSDAYLKKLLEERKQAMTAETEQKASSVDDTDKFQAGVHSGETVHDDVSEKSSPKSDLSTSETEDFYSV